MKITSLLLTFAVMLSVGVIVTVASADPPKVVPVPKPAADKRERLEGAVPGEMFQMSAEPASKWRLEGSPVAGVDLRSFDNGKTGVLVSKVPGVVGVIVTGPAGDSTFLDVVVGVPVPKPDAKDPLKEKLRVAFADDSEVDAGKKAGFRKDLAGLYRSIAEEVCPDKKVETASDLIARAQVSSSKLFKDTPVLLGVRKVVADELKLLLPILDAPLTDSQRAAVGDLFGRAAMALEGL